MSKKNMYWSNTSLFVITLLGMLAIITDISMNRITPFISRPTDPISNIVIFGLLASISLTVSQLIIKYLNIKRSESPTIKEVHILSIAGKIISVAQYSLFALLIFAIFQMLLFSKYSILILCMSVAISYILAVSILALLAWRFFLWFKADHNLLVISYGITFSMLSLNAIFTFSYVFNMLVNQFIQYSSIAFHVGSVTTFGAYTSSYYTAYVISSIISFIASWFSTALMLRHYSKNLGFVKYWFLLSIPLLYFLIQFDPLLLVLLSSFRLAYPVTFSILYTLIFTMAKPIGGILFGVAFWSIAATLKRDNYSIRSFLIISGYGLMLVFASNQAILTVNYPYPPFGLAAISFIGLSSYLLLIGIYSSAISVAHDVELRRSVRKLAIKEFKLLDSIGTSHMEQEIQSMVLKLASRQQEAMEEDTGIGSSLDEDDVKQYLDQVLKEVKGKENHDKLT
jgi:hypothetical protein